MSSVGPVDRLTDMREFQAITIHGREVALQWSTGPPDETWTEVRMPRAEARKLFQHLRRLGQRKAI